MVRRSLEDTATSSPSKRPRTTPTTPTTADHVAAFRPGLLSESTRTTLAEQFKTSTPYLHCAINELCDEELLRRVRKEIMASLHFTVKETDIYKVHQTGDLANLDGLPAHELQQLSSLFQLRNALYSPTFRQFIRDVTGCGPLSGTKTDMSINNYLNGCHLLNHDDVIGTRRVSYILYLPSPDEAWLPSYGGALELYPVVTKGTPDVAPTVSIPPKWNQFVMFTVQPGHSFHSVEEVVVDKSRLSISGWFHVPQEGEEGYSENAEEDAAAAPSLDQLQQGLSEPFVEFEGEVDPDAMEGLSEEDITELAKWLNPRYLNMSVLAQVSERFLEESSIQLAEFLNDELAEQIRVATTADDAACGFDKPVMPKHGTGVAGDWKVDGPPHKLRYLALRPSQPSSSTTTTTQTQPTPTTVFHTLTTHLFPTPAFRRWLALLTQLPPTHHRGLARRFRPGLDYTLAWSSPTRLLDATLCLTPSNPTLWESDEMGGYEAYMAPDDGDMDAAVYRTVQDEGALLTVSAGWNVLTIVVRDEGLMRFVKYVSAAAPGSRWDVSWEYQVPVDESDEEEDK
ncbi:Oxoglutarate and iron-dependent oxygenase degradation C-term-domain-containing protein [Fimicolochytrium jonesii]|uniref:Oxoglutarate and iron-dependent oxygenase degradation C-term-domain-containing protein n=1 Tax=Fimicolochytrium jonesii TaxID=1396493 RepID=UPI0022FE332F|nr:Oxoglutarate and iron-dependent oxygenase degradation C-term-domain-containing protein [Fimicolochytrium jonesii]KAI8818194.1 Oxoglutarate and iron-dependent oxygenase degradation C-term-domain-containing protein [Fimicolochytrium jonesii]